MTNAEDITVRSGTNIGFEPTTVSITNNSLSGKLIAPEAFRIENPLVILERVRDGARIGVFTLGTIVPNQTNEVDYTLSLRGEYNLSSTDKVTVVASPISESYKYIYSTTLGDLLRNHNRIELSKKED